ncbi:hypothetical protein FRX31_012229, partial [Thalictrum thalictroides]
MKAYIGWIVGDGTSIDIWKDVWLGTTISDRLQGVDWDFKANVSNTIEENNWNLPQSLQDFFTKLGIQLHDHSPISIVDVSCVM